MRTMLAATLPLILCLPGLAAADVTNKCRDDILQGQYVFTASGFTRPPASGPGTLGSQGDPRSPPFQWRRHAEHASGHYREPLRRHRQHTSAARGADGVYLINADCSGTVHFFDANDVMYKIYVDPPQGDTIWMIQTNPVNNVLQGSAKRVF